MTVPTQTRRMPTAFAPKKFIEALWDANITPKELSDEMNCSVEAIARWMAGIASPKPGYASHAATILGVDIEDLYE